MEENKRTNRKLRENNKNILEQILQEIESEIMSNPEIGRKQAEGMVRTMDIIKKYMLDNGGLDSSRGETKTKLKIEYDIYDGS